MSDLVVLALGGNAISPSGKGGTTEEQLENVDATAGQVARIVAQGYRVILTHGNGPQVGSLLIQQEFARGTVPEQPLYACGAMTQGHIGWMLQNRLRHHLSATGGNRPVATVITQVVVDKADPDFEDPSKPVGPFYTRTEAEALAQEKGYLVREVRPGAEAGWRRVVPSPRPKDIVEKEVIRKLVADGVVVIASGGGGVPVTEANGAPLTGVDAVVDKDWASLLLAEVVEADRLLILTDVPHVVLDYGGENQRELATVSVSEMEAFDEQGQFGTGSMKPKVEAAIGFVRRTGKPATITSLQHAAEGLAGEVGTHVVA